MEIKMKERNAVTTIFALLAVILVLTISLGVIIMLLLDTDVVKTYLAEIKQSTTLSLNYIVDSSVSQETLKADILKLLKLSADEEVTVVGEVDLNTPGKYLLVYIWRGNAREVEICVYDSSFEFVIDGGVVDGNTVYMDHETAVASQNFTKCIAFIDSIGNEMKVTKEANRAMDFNGKEGTYVVYYNPTDGAGQQFSLRVEYVVTSNHHISVSDAVALTYQDAAEIPVDFDGVTDAWLEDKNGKISNEYYEIKENALVLKKAYYNEYLGKKISLKLCSNYGNATFYVSVLDQEGYEDYMNNKILNLLSYNASFVTFQKASGSVDQVLSNNAYLYKKEVHVSADEGKLTINNAIGKFGYVSFDLYVKSAVGGASGDGVMEFQITDGAKFVSVKDADGNSVTVIYKNNMPYVVLDAGKVYSITLDLSESLYPTIRVWGAKGVEVYYYHFNSEKVQYEYIVDEVTRSILCRKSGEEYGYFAWPTVTKLDGDRLIAVSSGFRQAHVDPAGKVACWFSEDGGKTWSDPQVVADTLLDDRDAGVVYWNGKIIVSWFCASKVYYLNNNASKYQAWANTIPEDYDTKYMGGNYIISEDGGKTWSEIYSMPDGMFTPHGLIVNPDGGLTSVGYLKYDKVNKTWGTGIGVRFTDGTMDENGFVWSDAIVIATDTEQNEKTGWDFQEPYGIYNDDGVLIVVMRSNKGLYQCELQPGEDKFSDWHLIAFVQETPAHMIQHSSGVMIMTYGYRGIYIDPVAGNTVSYTERNKDTTLGIRARLSYDGGLTWTREVILSYGLKPVDNSSDWGYTSSVELSDGKIVTVYYQRTSGETMASIYQIVWELPEAFEGEVTLTFVGGKAPNGSTDNGDGLLITTLTGNVGDTIVLPENPTKEGYRFDGWCLDYAGNIPFVATTYSKDLTLYAKWVKE
ncbi:MAG: InlB B-repeat-containing protein [Clostridia bacterium]|nr:InlB B-repeat-containing protein [Clostridia bacterium]